MPQGPAQGLATGHRSRQMAAEQSAFRFSAGRTGLAAVKCCPEPSMSRPPQPTQAFTGAVPGLMVHSGRMMQAGRGGGKVGVNHRR